MQTTTLLVDGDEYLFKAVSACEREIHWDEWNHVLYCNRIEAWDNFQRMVGQLEERFETTSTILCFSGAQPYFRHDLYPAYKGGRPGRKPLCYTQLREQCDDFYITKSYPRLEADDCLGILATKPARDPRSIICSQDKDMLTVPGNLWREGVLTEVTERQAMQWHYYQTVIGDHTDNYPGCPGFGPKRAEEWFEEHGWTWAAVVAAYEKKGLKETDALLQARLARILQWSDWDYERKEPILWTPTS